MSAKRIKCVNLRSGIECWGAILLKVAVGVKIKWSVRHRILSGVTRCESMRFHELQYFGNKLISGHKAEEWDLPQNVPFTPIKHYWRNILSCIDYNVNIITDWRKGSAYQLHCCKTLGHTESTFYQDGTLRVDWNTRNTQAVTYEVWQRYAHASDF